MRKQRKANTTARIFKAQESVAATDYSDSYLTSVEKQAKIAKAHNQTSVQDISSESKVGLQNFLSPIYDPKSLREIVNHSTILPQCTKAYGQNIAGIGYEIAYWEDPGNADPTPEQQAEHDRLDEILTFMSLDSPLCDLLSKVIEDRESVASGYLEIERDGESLPARAYYVEPEFIEISKLSNPIQTVVVLFGKSVTTWKRFRTFRQRVNTLTGYQSVYFKEFGDPRILDNRTGLPLTEGSILEDQYVANEIVQFKIGSGVYGTPRWIGQSIHVQGARLAEELNYRYFVQGRHVNMAILVEGGTLTQESVDQLQLYMDGVQGVDNSHKILLLEMDSANDEDTIIDDNKKTKPTLKIEHMNDLVQTDALFLGYTDESRKKVQSSFNLPDIYVGRSSDYNFATSKTAVEVTERQVFGPERDDVSWLFNNKILAEYEFQHVYVKLKGPKINDQDFQIQFFNAASAAGGVTPDDARKLLEKVFDMELQPFDQDWSKVPLPILSFINAMSDAVTTNPSDPAAGIAKSLKQDKFVSVLKEVKKALQEYQTSTEGVEE